MAVRHELFFELEAIDARWQSRYHTLAAAAAEYGLIELYHAYLRTPEGIAYRQSILSAHDHRKDNAARKAQIDAEISLAAGAGFQFGEPA